LAPSVNSLVECDLTRRHLIAAGAVAALLCPLSAALVLAGRGAGDTENLAKWLKKVFSDLESAKAVGLRYIQHYPGEAHAAALSHTITCLRNTADHQSMNEAFASQRNLDFRRGDSMLIDGWVVSRIEARCCVLTVVL
jgi:phage terminase large subunit-like protein